MHKEKHDATHMSFQNIHREKMMRRDDEKGPCKHKAKHISNIKVVRIYGERERAKEWSCMHAEHGWCEKSMVREKKERRIWTHAYVQEYHMGYHVRNISRGVPSPSSQLNQSSHLQ